MVKNTEQKFANGRETAENGKKLPGSAYILKALCTEGN